VDSKEIAFVTAGKKAFMAAALHRPGGVGVLPMTLMRPR
jgi:hypothetical protein